MANDNVKNNRAYAKTLKKNNTEFKFLNNSVCIFWSPTENSVVDFSFMPISLGKHEELFKEEIKSVFEEIDDLETRWKKHHNGAPYTEEQEANFIGDFNLEHLK